MRTTVKNFAMLALVASVLAPAHPAAGAQNRWLADAEIEQMLKGRTLAGMYASGRRFSEHYQDNGDLEYTEDGITIRGHWSVRSGTLCTIYDTDPTGGCFRVALSGAKCFEFYFVARTEAAAPGPPDVKPDWTARGTTEGEADACEDGAHV